MAQGRIDDELLAATKDLSDQVHTLSGRLSAKELLHKRTRMLTIIAIVIGILSVVGVGISGYTIYQNAENAKTSCLNANESRSAQANIWGYVYASNEGDPELTEEEKLLIQRLKDYTNAVFAPRDCNDLSKEYELPPPPIPPKID